MAIGRLRLPGFLPNIGFDLDYDYIKPYLHEDGIRVSTGIKYYRITGNTDDKEPYHPDRALEKAATHAGNFMFYREKQVEFLYDFLGRGRLFSLPMMLSCLATGGMKDAMD